MAHLTTGFYERAFELSLLAQQKRGDRNWLNSNRSAFTKTQATTMQFAAHAKKEIDPMGFLKDLAAVRM